LKKRYAFKACPQCGKTWENRGDFLADPEIETEGYEVNFEDLISGSFHFRHSCGGLIRFPVGTFRDLYAGPIFQECAAGSRECPEYCLRRNNLGPCPTRCECAYVRDILQIIRRWPKA